MPSTCHAFTCVISCKQPHKEGYLVTPLYRKKPPEILRSYIFSKQTHSNDQRQDGIKLSAMLLSWGSFSEELLISFFRCPGHRVLTESMYLSLSCTHGFQYNLCFSFRLLSLHTTSFPFFFFFFSLSIEDFYLECVPLNALSPPYHLLQS